MIVVEQKQFNTITLPKTNIYFSDFLNFQSI